MEEGRGTPATDVAPELVLDGAAEVALHGDVRLWGRLPFEHPVREGALDGARRYVTGFKHLLEYRAVRAEEMGSTAREVGGGCGGVVGCVEAQLRFDE